MRPPLCWIVLPILILVVALPAAAADAKKEPAPVKPAPDKAAQDKYVPVGSLRGVVRSADGSRLTLGVTYQSVQASGTGQKVTSVTKDVPLELANIVKVRSTQPLQQFDDKGNIKKSFTPKELKELKGDEKLPGYAAESTDLHAGQMVFVKLARFHPAKPADAPPPAAGKGKPTGKAEPATAPKIVVTLVLIATER